MNPIMTEAPSFIVPEAPSFIVTEAPSFLVAEARFLLRQKLGFYCGRSSVFIAAEARFLLRQKLGFYCGRSSVFFLSSRAQRRWRAVEGSPPGGMLAAFPRLRFASRTSARHDTYDDRSAFRAALMRMSSLQLNALHEARPSRSTVFYCARSTVFIVAEARFLFCHPERSADGAQSRDRHRAACLRRSLDCGSLREPLLGMTRTTIDPLLQQP